MLIELNFKMGQMTSELDWESFWRDGKKFLIIIPFQVKISDRIDDLFSFGEIFRIDSSNQVSKVNCLEFFISFKKWLKI